MRDPADDVRIFGAQNAINQNRRRCGRNPAERSNQPFLGANNVVLCDNTWKCGELKALFFPIHPLDWMMFGVSCGQNPAQDPHL